MNEVRLEGYIALNMNVTENGLGYIQITNEVLNQLEVDSASAGNMINNFNFIKEVLVWATITEDIKNDQIRVSIRSRGPEINEVAEREKIMKLEEEKYIHPRRPKYLKKRQNSASLPKKKTIDESNKDDGYTQFKSRYPKYLKKYKKQKETENKNDNEGDDYVDNADDQQNKTAIN
jgi:hypothetical protein